jgi:hypothetical protein
MILNKFEIIAHSSGPLSRGACHYPQVFYRGWMLKKPPSLPSPGVPVEGEKDA